MNKGIITFIGFLLFLFGFVSLVLSMIGIQLAFLTWIDIPGRLFGFVFRLLMIIGGIVLVAAFQIDWEAEKVESGSVD